MAMRLRLGGFPLGDIHAELRADGLAFSAEIGGVSPLPTVKATLLLRWIEVAIIVVLVVIGSVIVHYRARIASSWLIGQWAPVHLRTSATIVAGAGLFFGWVLAAWKKGQLFTYSIAEIVFGVFSIFQIALVLWPDGALSKFIGLGSAVYVVSRGAGNLWDALVQEAEIERLQVQVTA